MDSLISLFINPSTNLYIFSIYLVNNHPYQSKYVYIILYLFISRQRTLHTSDGQCVLFVLVNFNYVTNIV